MKPFPSTLIAIFALCSASSVYAQKGWNGGTDQSWATASNWDPSGVPSGSDALSFGLANSYTVHLGNATRSSGEATFNSADAYVFEGGGAGGILSFNAASGITQNGSGGITFNHHVAFTGSSARTVGGTGAGVITFNGAVSRTSGAITFSGANEIIFTGSGANSFGSAAITVGGAGAGNATILTLAKTTKGAQDTALGSGTINLSNGTLKISNSDATLSNSIQIGSGNGIIETDRSVILNGQLSSNASRTLIWNNTQKITQAGDVTSSGSGVGSTRTFMLAGFGDVDFTGVMYDSTADKPLAITKNGTGTFRFIGDNTYSGATLVSAGTLLVNGTTSGQGSFTVNTVAGATAGGTLGGTGIIGLSATSSVSMTSADATIAPGEGDGVGILTIDGGGGNATAGLLLNSGTLVFDIAGLACDKIVLVNFAEGGGNGSSTAGVGGIFITLNGMVDLSGGVYELIEFASTPGISADRFALSAESLDAGWIGTFGYQGDTLTFTAIPEAGASALLIGATGLLGALGMRRKATNRLLSQPRGSRGGGGGRALLSTLFLALAAFSQPRNLGAEEMLMALVGDSTVSNYEPAQALRGWGQILSGWTVEGARVVNYARSGSSSKSFLTRGDWKETLAAKPKIVFIQFGHNDRAKDPARGTAPEEEYRLNLKRFISETREVGGKPILVTPPVPRAFNSETGKLGDGRLGPYVAVMKAVGEEENVCVLDLFTRSFQWFESLGAEGAKESAPRVGDINHYNQAGAEKLAWFVLEEMQGKAPEAAAFFSAPGR